MEWNRGVKGRGLCVLFCVEVGNGGGGVRCCMTTFR